MLQCKHTMKNTITKKQIEIIKTLENLKGFCTAQTIHANVPTMNLTTVYRGLEKLVEKNLVYKIVGDNGEAFYEYKKEIHHHSICTSCDTISHIKLGKEFIKKIPELSHFDPESIEITIRGKCI